MDGNHDDPGTNYRYLTSGETIREGDDFYDPLYGWMPSRCAGERVGADTGLYRRQVVTDENAEGDFHCQENR